MSSRSSRIVYNWHLRVCVGWEVLFEQKTKVASRVVIYFVFGDCTAVSVVDSFLASSAIWKGAPIC